MSIGIIVGLTAVALLCLWRTRKAVAESQRLQEETSKIASAFSASQMREADLSSTCAELRSRLAPILSLEIELPAVQERTRTAIERLNGEIRAADDEHQRIAQKITGERETLARDYSEAKATYDALRRQISLLEENLETFHSGCTNRISVSIQLMNTKMLSRDVEIISAR